MRKRSWILLFLILGFLFLLMIAVPFALWRMISEEPSIQAGTFIELEISGDLAESRETGRFGGLLAERGLSIYEIRQLLQAAAQDARVPALYLKVRPLTVGWGAVEELRDIIQEFRKSKKKVYALLDSDVVEEKEYYLACTADRLFINPEGGFLLNGLIAEVMFYRKAFDKLRVQPQFLQFKEYKSAAEPYSREHMSEFFRVVLDSLLGDIQSRFVNAIAETRQIEATRVQALMDEALFLPSRALQEKLVDRLGYADEVEQALAEDFLKDAKKEYKGVSAERYFRAVDKPAKLGAKKVALIFASGIITSGKSENFSEMIGGETMSSYIRAARKDKDVRAIILRVNSPGGSAVGSDLVWREVRLAKKDKPVVVSMSSVAGSGGYYISMAADAIVCQPSTLTGSIGVLGGKFNLRGLLEWLGINVDTVKKSKNADLLSPFSSMDNDQMKRFSDWMEALYKDFVSKAAEGRHTTFDKLEPLAHGRVWTGEQAKENGLIDELGGLDVAIKLAKQKANIKPDEELDMVIYPKKRSLLDFLANIDLAASRLVRQPHDLEQLRQWARALEQLQPWLMMPEVVIH